MSTIELKVISSLEKCLHSDRIEDKKEKKEFFMFKNERLSFQIAFFNSEVEMRFSHYPVRCGGALAKYATVRRVVNVPVAFPCRPGDDKGVYIKKEPGLYPDLLQPLHYNNAISSPYNQLQAVWVDIELPEEVDAVTFGGLVFMHLTEIPDDGSSFEIECYGLHILVDKFVDRRVESAVVTKLPCEETQETE